MSYKAVGHQLGYDHSVISRLVQSLFTDMKCLSVILTAYLFNVVFLISFFFSFFFFNAS